MRRPTTSFALTDHQREFAAQKVAEGRFASHSEVMRAAMRLLEQEELKLDRLRAAIRAGIESGEAEDFDPEQFLAERREP